MSTVDDLQAVADRINQTIVGLGLLAAAIPSLRNAAQPNDITTQQLLDQLQANINSGQTFIQQTLAQLATAQDEAKADAAKLAVSTPGTTTVSPAAGYTVGQMTGVGVGGVVLGLGLGYMLDGKRVRR